MAGWYNSRTGGARKAADAALRGHAVALAIRPLRTDGAAVTRRIRLEAPVILA